MDGSLFCHVVPLLRKSLRLYKIPVFIPRALFKERGIKLIEEKVKPAFKKIHDYCLDVSKHNTD